MGRDVHIMMMLMVMLTNKYFRLLIDNDKARVMTIGKFYPYQPLSTYLERGMLPYQQITLVYCR